MHSMCTYHECEAQAQEKVTNGRKNALNKIKITVAAVVLYNELP